MFDPGLTEVLLIFVIGLLILGPERLPRVAAQLGRWMGKARRTAHQLRMQIEREMTMSDIMRDKKEREQREADAQSPESSDGGAVSGSEAETGAQREYPEEEDANDSGHGDAGGDESVPAEAATEQTADDAESSQKHRA